MGRQIRILGFVVFILLNNFYSLFSQIIEELEFRNQPVRDVLLVLAEIGNLSIITDETVTGNTSHYFSNVSVQEAMDIILRPHNLYAQEHNGVLYISRIRIQFDRTSDTLTIDAEDVSLNQIIRAISREIGVSILNDRLPTQLISLHSREVSPLRALEIIATQFPSIQVESKTDHFYVKNVETQNGRSNTNSDATEFSTADELYSIDTANVPVSALLENLFMKEGREYALLKRGDRTLERFNFQNKTFTEMLELLLQLSDSDFTEQNGIFYIYEINRNDILKSFDNIVRISVEYLTVTALINLFPTGLITSSNYKIDQASNTIILNGSSAEIGPVVEFIHAVDVPVRDRSWIRFDLAHSLAEDIIAIIPDRFKSNQAVPMRNSQSFLMLLSEDQASQLYDFIQLADQKERGRAVDLRFIQAEQLLENLPPSVNAENIIATVDPRRVFFKGSQASFELFLSELEDMDRPVPQIRYEVIVIQQSEASVLDFSGLNLANSRAVTGDESSYLGVLGNIMSLSFDIVSNFGYLFALDLNFKLNNKEASVLADTTLNGLSGQEVRFQNTQTFRYQETEIDPDSGEPVNSGVTREIISGLIINISGWVSGDGMITMDVNSTISKQGAASGSNPPTTSQRLIDTHVRTQSGTAVVIGGLVQQEESNSTSETPGLGSVPVLGELFTGRDRSRENSHMIVYIVPHIEYPYYESSSLTDIFEALYERHGYAENSGL